MAGKEQELALKQAMETASRLRSPYLKDEMVSAIYRTAEAIARRAITHTGDVAPRWQKTLDDIATSRATGIPLMLAMLAGAFWLTLVGANIPSRILSECLFRFQEVLSGLSYAARVPTWLHGILIEGMYRTLAWVVSVMLPPMAIFFPLFTLLEDLGYLPRVAFNLDALFRIAGAHGKQALTMSMGFGCNAAGVIACRIIESPRERLIAILTNNFVPCNGRFPTLFTLSMLFIGGTGFFGPSLAAALAVILLVMLGILVTFLVSLALSRTLLKGVPSAFVFELPPYRRPQVLRVLLRSALDRTLFVLGRAVAMAAPAGGVTWTLAHVRAGNMSLLHRMVALLNPAGRLLGFDGAVLTAFILGLPANEIVLPIAVMTYLAEGALVEPESLDALRHLLVSQGWTAATAVSVMLFSLLHYPCSTTLWTIHRETQSVKWTVAAAAIPMAVACLVVMLFRLVLVVASWVYGLAV